jgi:YD repeat-containing protein
VLLVAVLALPPLADTQEVRYIYDDLNRLIGVVDQQGNAAEYVYDAVGNVLQIKQFTVDPNAAVGITLVRPTSGPVGATVQIFGKGFSPTPGANQLAFNGAAATVTAATATSLTTTVPAGATTGPITLTTTLGAATSPEPFTVVVFAVVPAQAAVPVQGNVGFQATLDGSALSDVTWRVNGVVGGSPTLGTISATGRYTAPGTVPAGTTPHHRGRPDERPHPGRHRQPPGLPPGERLRGGGAGHGGDRRPGDARGEWPHHRRRGSN